MFVIDISDFTLDKFLEEIGHTETVGAKSHVYEGGYAIKVQVNNKCIANDPKQSRYPTAYMLNTILKNINNAFYELLIKAEKAEINFERGSGASQEILKMEIKDIVLLFSTFGENFDNYIENEPSDFKESVKEAIHAINKYKDICMETAQRGSSKNVWGFMETIFGKEERYTKDQFDDKGFDWAEYCTKQRKRRCTSKEINIHMAKSTEEANKLSNKYIRGKGCDEWKRHCIIRNYYDWQPLETTWEKIEK